jgi:hypothetical protein
MNWRKFFIERLQRCENGDERLGRCRLNDKPLPLFTDNCVLAGQLKLARNSHGLIAPIFEKLHVPFCHAKTWHMLWHMSIVDHT